MIFMLVWLVGVMLRVMVYGRWLFVVFRLVVLRFGFMLVWVLFLVWI